PILGFVMILCELVDKILNKFNISKKITICFSCCLLIVFFFLSNIKADKYINEHIYWNNAYNDAPNYHVACLFKAYIEFEQGNFEKAEELMKKIMEYNYNLYVSNFAILLFEEKKYEDAKFLFIESIKQNISVALSYEYLSKIFLYYNETDKALKCAKLAVEKEPYTKEYKEYLQKLTNETNNI
ncbi:MAG: hypothetical protein IKN42_07325, partial [Elusimicrobia bacterium]|nr:hypothetical protein [Elusimicrobiota bacterium]